MGHNNHAGYVAVKNRSTKDLRDGMTLVEARSSEKMFFASHPAFSTLEAAVWGIETLSQRLIDILVSRIQVAVPEMEKQVQRLLDETSLKLSTLGREVPLGSDACKREYFSMVQQIVMRYATAVDGTYSAQRSERWARLYARVHVKWEDLRKMIHTTWPMSLENLSDCLSLKQEAEEDSGSFLARIIAAELKDLRGRELTEVFNSRAFNYFVSVFVKDWVEISTECLKSCLLITREVLSGLVDDIFKQFPFLLSAVRETVVVKLVQDKYAQAVQNVSALLDLEGDPFTLNHYLWDTVNKTRLARFEEQLNSAIDESKSQVYDGDVRKHVDSFSPEVLRRNLMAWFNKERGIGCANNHQEAEEMIILLHAYWKTATKRFVDNVCNVIDENLCKATKSCLMQTLTELSTDSLDRYFVEDSNVVLLRKSLVAKLDRLGAAKEALQKDFLRE
uniref:GED domain-containing protein n=1 Tax=Pyramimonas obovata TaxID=1411642 RepID=A0A7S0MZ32_9CHLO|mmetsp:Transcript_16826/g.36605  ORF Transcript_16826/g.36605 Transcript_16826/m.36605 type:complete len:448 (+) Transcript_16826:408-1751(+)|eukprot:CAMPEP_0118931424 /NCGR_PEP_ID=MMETSP1169-20130426/7768_1 /TAXON_ID=36882 /ORGANISM="Pyramimonas obovata, Strain CCMP722" /LENGTH=447 /DNA_ID=CAMNT_0006873923 /DNA_START=397 /DNA_END=1740 /DNA_ORIENTATION=+